MNSLYIHYYRWTAIWILFMSVLLCPAQEILTLDACIREVQSSNPDTRQLANIEARLSIQQHVNTLKLLPQAHLNGKATWQSDVTSIPIEVPGFEIPMPDQDQYAVSLDITQSIYNGGSLRARSEILNQESLLSALQYQSDLHSTEAIAIDAFYRILLQQQLVGTADLLIAQLNSTIRSLEHHLASGTVDKKDILLAQVTLKEALQKRKEALYYQDAAKHVLAILMGRDDILFEVKLLSSFEKTGESMFEDRSEIRTFGARMGLLQSMERLNRTLYYPKLSAFASLGYGKPGLNFLSDEFGTYAIIGLTASIPLTQLYSRTSSRESQIFKLQQEEVLLAKEKLLQYLQTQEVQRLAEIEKLTAWILDDDEIITMRREMVDLASLQRNAGIISTTDYLDEITGLSLAEEKRVTHEVLLQRELALLKNLYGISALNQ